MFGLGTTELIIILVLVLIIFGAGKLPQVGGALGKGLRNFKDGVKDGEEEKAEAGESTDEDERARLDERLTSFRTELEEIRQGAQKQGLQDVQRTLQTLDAAQAKEQLLIMYEDERIDDVVTIVQAMSTDKRKDILAEFVSVPNDEPSHSLTCGVNSPLSAQTAISRLTGEVGGSVANLVTKASVLPPAVSS